MKRLLPVLLFAGWLTILGGGFAALHLYEARPGSDGHVSDGRPEQPPARAELVLFAHPQCPCTRSALVSLARVDAAERCSIRIVFVGPEGANEKWWAGRNRQLASEVPGASVELDAGGRIAIEYGVRTSGHAVVHAPDGRLLFSGGLTATDRSPFPVELARLLADPPAAPLRRPVSGCPLFDE